MPIPGNNLQDNRFMSTDPSVSGAYWHEEALRLKSRVEELEAWQKSLAEGLGYLNQPEGQSGYEVATPEEIIREWHEAQAREDRYRAALERICDLDEVSSFSDTHLIAREALNPK